MLDEGGRKVSIWRVGWSEKHLLTAENGCHYQRQVGGGTWVASGKAAS